MDNASVYWTNYAGGTVMKVPVGGGAVATLASNQNYPRGIAVDATNVYWANGGSGDSDGGIMKVSLRGVGPTILGFQQFNPGAVGVDATNIYWGTADGAVRKLPLGGGKPITLTTEAVSRETMIEMAKEVDGG